MTIEMHSVVSMHYTLKDDEGIVLDSSEGREPLVYLQGAGNIIPGLEKQLEGKTTGDKVQATVGPEEGYGTRQQELIQQVPKDQFPKDEPLAVGMQFSLQMDHGPMIATITEVAEEHATIDMNHPLADKTLHFDVEIVEVRVANPDEKAHGHVHGPGGHQH